jgi:hypothetical protein
MKKRDRLRNLENFQGKLSKINYFEGWYFKQVSKSQEISMSFIPGISLSGEDRHAFVQVIQSPGPETHYFRYPLEAFSWEENEFSISIGPNRFSLDGVVLDLKDDESSISGTLEFSEMKQLNGTHIMGPFAHLSFLECYHSVISMDHRVEGRIDYLGKVIKFEQSQGYIEKDWGKSFPKSYIWMQANHFKSKGTSFMLSVATVPMKAFAFTGFLCHLMVGEKDYRFTTYTGAQIKKIEEVENGIRLILVHKKIRLEILAQASESGALKSPVNGAMSGTIREGLESRMTLKLIEEDTVLFEGESNHGGFERYNDEPLLKKWR